MELAIIKPAADLADLVRFYCLCDDPEGSYLGRNIVTAPQLGLCLCLQLNDFVLTDFADPRPLMSISGVQPRLRHYVPEGSVRALIMFFTPLGSIRLAPHEGPTLYAEGFDSGSLFGDGAVQSLRQAASAAPDPDAIGHETDAWLRRMFQIAAHATGTAPSRKLPVFCAMAIPPSVWWLARWGWSGRQLDAVPAPISACRRKVTRCSTA